MWEGSGEGWWGVQGWAHKSFLDLAGQAEKALATVSGHLSHDKAPSTELCHTTAPAQKLVTAGVMGEQLQPCSRLLGQPHPEAKEQRNLGDAVLRVQPFAPRKAQIKDTWANTRILGVGHKRNGINQQPGA